VIEEAIFLRQIVLQMKFSVARTRACICELDMYPRCAAIQSAVVPKPVAAMLDSVRVSLMPVA